MSLKNISIILIVLFIGGVLSDDIEMMRIFNGDRATIEDFPHTVYINKNGFHHCGGSIISEDIVLTAAHCFTNTDLDELTISVGTSDCIEVIDERKLENVIIHEKFVEDNLKNDIAVMKLKHPLKFRHTVQPIKLMKAGDTIPDGKIVRTAGCGTIDERGVSRDVKKLLSATLRALSEEECADLEPKFNAESLICLRDDKEHASVCHGDSGSGFLVDGKLAGVVSYGPKVCGESPLSGATKVSMFINWIQDKIAELNGKPATVWGSEPLDAPKDQPQDYKEEQKHILKTKLNADSSEETSSGSESSESESRSYSSESDDEYGERVIREERSKVEDMMRSIKQMMFRVKQQKISAILDSQKEMRALMNERF